MMQEEESATGAGMDGSRSRSRSWGGGSTHSTLMRTTNKTATATVATAAETKKKTGEQQQPRSKNNNKGRGGGRGGGSGRGGGATCCHKPQHNSKVYATHNGKLQRNITANNSRGRGRDRLGKRAQCVGDSFADVIGSHAPAAASAHCFPPLLLLLQPDLIALHCHAHTPIRLLAQLQLACTLQHRKNAAAPCKS